MMEIESATPNSTAPAWMHLALFEPPTEANRICDFGLLALCEMIAFLDEGKTWWTPGELADSIHSLFEMEFGSEEVERVLRDVGEQAFLVNETPFACQLTLDRRSRLESDRAEQLAVEKAAVEEWLHSSLETADLDGETRERFGKGIIEFNTRLGLKYVQSLASNAGDIAVSRTKFAELVACVSTIPASLREAFLAAATDFWQNQTPLRAAYVAKHLDRCFVVSALSVDSHSSELLRAAWGETILYLDTSTAFRLLNFDGPRKYHSVHAVIQMAKAAGVEIRVSTATISELQSALNRHHDEARRNPITNPALASLAAEHMSEESFLRAYNLQFSAQRLSLSEFQAYVRNIGSVLESEGIAIDRTKVEDLPEFQANADAHLHYLQGDAGHTIYVEEAEPKTEHDFSVWALVRHVRGGAVSSYAEAHAWLLTLHKRLWSYHSFARSSSTEVPYFITPTRLMQALRFILPRAGDDQLDEQFMILVASNLVRARTPAKDRVLQRIGHIVSTYINQRQMGEDQAEKLFSVLAVDGALADQMENTQNLAAEKEAFDAALARATASAVEKADLEVALRRAAQDRDEDSTSRLAERESDVTELAQRVSDLERNRKEDSSRFSEKLVAQEEKFTEKIDARDRQATSMRQKHSLYKAEVFRIFAYTLLLAASAMDPLRDALNGMAIGIGKWAADFPSAILGIVSSLVVLFPSKNRIISPSIRVPLAGLGLAALFQKLLGPGGMSMLANWAQIGAVIFGGGVLLWAVQKMQATVDSQGPPDDEKPKDS